MNAHARQAALFLLLAPGPLAELLSQNVPLSTYLQPLPFLLVSVTYGVPVLLIRELAVTRKLNEIGVALLGLAYGILNEGILAKTLTQPDGAPLGSFAGYGQIAAIQGGWAIFIVFWHALHSVLYPILLSRWLFPAAADRRWFVSRRARWWFPVLIIILIGLYSLYFLNPVRSDLAAFLLYIAATAGLVGGALRFCKARAPVPASPTARPSLKPVLSGACMLVLYLFQFWSPGNVPFVLYVAISTAIIGFLAAWIVRTRWRPLPDLLLFGVGDYLTFSVLSALLSVVTGRNSLQAVAAGAIFVVAFLYLLRAVRKEPLGRGVPCGLRLQTSPDR